MTLSTHIKTENPENTSSNTTNAQYESIQEYTMEKKNQEKRQLEDSEVESQPDVDRVKVMAVALNHLYPEVTMAEVTDGENVENMNENTKVIDGENCVKNLQHLMEPLRNTAQEIMAKGVSNDEDPENEQPGNNLNEKTGIKQMDDEVTKVKSENENSLSELKVIDVPKEEIEYVVKDEIVEEDIILKIKKQRKKDNQTKRNLINKDKYSCGVCGKTFPVQSKVSKHMVTHSKVKEFKCELCGSLFALPEHLKRHLKRVHVPDKKDRRKAEWKPGYMSVKEQRYVCDNCGKDFGSMSNLGLHQRLVHDGVKPFNCEECNQTFKRKDQIPAHMVKEHGYPYPCLCPECGQGFLRLRGLKQHVEIVHLGQRGFQCQECGKSFTREHSLTVHKLTHTKETPFSCEYCSQGYKEKRNLLKHIERSHPNESTAMPDV